MPDNCVGCEAAYAGHNSIFCRAMSDSGANTQACRDNIEFKTQNKKN